ncbi:MAG: KH domain-containing protein [Anaerolineae bacterium]|nr:KH domain-containing protein [Anaerolineae bacterium]
MRPLIEFIAHNLVEHPEKVQVLELVGPRATLYRLRVDASDVGRVIGKGGSVANAMRTVLRVAAEKKGQRAVLEID